MRRVWKLAVAGGLIVLAVKLVGAPSTETATSAARPTKVSYIEQLRDVAGERAEGIPPQNYEAAAAIIRRAGYDCPKADLMIRFVFSSGYDVYCRDGRYKFELANHGGQWSVTPP